MLLPTAVLIAGIMLAMACTQDEERPKPANASAKTAADGSAQDDTARNTGGDAGGRKLPKMIDLGAGKCIPCKKMKPILDELRVEYKDKFDVVFIDVWKNPNEGKKYGIEMIPTQIFFAPDGKELFRHVGFYSREEILNKWKELGLNVGE